MSTIIGPASDLIKNLERINQIIDLFIDRELYKFVENVLEVESEIINQTDLPKINPSEYIKQLRVDGKKSFGDCDVKFFESIDYPIHAIINYRDKKNKIPNFFQISGLFQSKIFQLPFEFEKEAKSFPLLKYWSDLFFAKRVRAELMKINKKDWLDRYDDLILFLESRMPILKPSDATKADFYTTQFNYLMELSAVAQGEASLGYAERAGKLLKFLFDKYDDPERGPYDRWIAWNKGTAYQHRGNNQKAVLEFNWVIKEFWHRKNLSDEGHNSESHKNIIKNILANKGTTGYPAYLEVVIEFLTNVVPAYLQRAAINLKLQLSYHALQTLSKNIDNCLKKIKKDNAGNVLLDVASHLEKQVILHRIEALLQFDLADEAKKWLKKAHDEIFKDNSWDSTTVKLPLNESNLDERAIKTKLVEHTSAFFYQKASLLLNIIRNPKINRKLEKNDCDKETLKEIEQSLSYLEGLTKLFFEADNKSTSYWDWVEDNSEDERIYLSRWAQLLKIGSEALHELKKYDLMTERHNPLLSNLIKLYLARRNRLPVARNERDKRPSSSNEAEKTIELENLRSDDLPDFTNGISIFYEKMSNILLRDKCGGKLKCGLKAKAVEILNDHSLGPINIQNDHIQVLDALNEYEKEFGQNQQIKMLKRHNEKLFWQSEPEGCKGCLDNKKTRSENPYHFKGLLTCCHGEKSKENEKEVLYREDYQNIMHKAETLFLKHLEIPSLQRPIQNALHFLGLQRWNSLTPAQGRSVGGGYLIYRTDKKGQIDLGIALDPGFDFVRNLFRMGFSLRDIDIVIISHAHQDHLWDFETLVQLLHDLEKKTGIIHRLNVVMTLGSYKRLAHLINNQKLRSYINPLVVDICKEVDPSFWRNISDSDKYSLKFFDAFKVKGETDKKKINCSKFFRWQPVLPNLHNPDNAKAEIEIQPTWAYHEDYTDVSDCFGFKINVIESDLRGNSRKFCFGYTSDTKWVGEDLYPSESWQCIASQYKECDVILLHIGSLINHKKGNGFEQYTKDNGACAKLIREENHPYLMGTIRFLKNLGYPDITSTCQNQKLIFLGEFGEELRGGIRTDLVKRLQGMENSTWPILPVDVGFDVLLYDYNNNNSKPGDRFKFLCALCDDHRPISEIDYFRFGQDEAIFHICKTCLKATPADVRETKLRKLYETGRELQTLPDTYQ